MRGGVPYSSCTMASPKWLGLSFRTPSSFCRALMQRTERMCTVAPILSTRGGESPSRTLPTLRDNLWREYRWVALKSFPEWDYCCPTELRRPSQKLLCDRKAGRLLTFGADLIETVCAARNSLSETIRRTVTELMVASTRLGSNWIPRYLMSSDTTFSNERAFRYGRSVLIASIVSEIMMIRAPKGIASPEIPSGYPLPSHRS